MSRSSGKNHVKVISEDSLPISVLLKRTVHYAKSCNMEDIAGLGFAKKSLWSPLIPADYEGIVSLVLHRMSERDVSISVRGLRDSVFHSTMKILGPES